MVIKDLHWIDSVSEESPNKRTDSEAKLRLLVLTTRRPEYSPPWLDRSAVTKSHLKALPAGDIRRLVQNRLGVEVLPEAFARQVTEKAEGNPLFAEEIVSYPHRAGHHPHHRWKFDRERFGGSSAYERAKPADRTGGPPRAERPCDSASGLGDRTALRTRNCWLPRSGKLPRCPARRDDGASFSSSGSKSSDYLFKHALVRDALYQSLLSDARRLCI